MADVSGHEVKLENKSLYPSRDIAFREALLDGTIYDSDDAWRRFSNRKYRQAFMSWDRQMKGQDEMVDTEAYPVNCAFKAVSKGRYFVNTSRGHIGWAPRGAEIGDFVIVMPGGKVPYI
ncbi:hypothetical protein P3342_002044 [Pyrenophora teres f. teres]|nr:hypothetical protein P3342_002044 [Pyrenophora teres f. teres]